MISLDFDAFYSEKKRHISKMETSEFDIPVIYSRLTFLPKQRWERLTEESDLLDLFSVSPLIHPKNGIHTFTAKQSV
jgi:hypothetical protein